MPWGQELSSSASNKSATAGALRASRATSPATDYPTVPSRTTLRCRCFLLRRSAGRSRRAWTSRKRSTSSTTGTGHEHRRSDTGRSLLTPGCWQTPCCWHAGARGNACLSGLNTGSMANLDRRVNHGSKGCGTVMRSAPFGLVTSWTPEDAFDAAVAGAMLSHGHDTALVSAGALTMIVRHLFDGAVLADAVDITTGTWRTTRASPPSRRGRPSDRRWTS
jgi:hypothetical protein